MPNSEIKVVQVGEGGPFEAWEVTAPWGTLHVHEGNIFGLQQLWLPNISLSPSMARDLAAHLTLAADKAEEATGA